MVSRDDLYRLVWAEPMTRVAERFGVSGSYLARVCTTLNVPRPPLGFWAKRSVGKAPPQTPLPPLRPGDPEHWSHGDQPIARPRPIAPAPPSERKKARIARDAVHRLISGARVHFESGRPVKEGAYLKPYKKLLVDVTASAAALLPALELANMLFNALEASGCRVVIAAAGQSLRRGSPDEREAGGKPRERWQYPALWSPVRPTVVYVGEAAIGLAIVEMSEHVMLRYIGNGRYIRESEYVPPRSRMVDHSWTTNDDLPSGRFRIMAYSPYSGVEWSEHWQDTKTTSLRDRIRIVVVAIEAMAPVLLEKIRQADHEAKIRRQQWLEEEERRRREEDRRRAAQSVIDSRSELQEIIGQWSRVVSIEQFLNGVTERAKLLPEEDRDQILSRLDLARTFIGTQDPLNFFCTWKTPDERYAPRYPLLDESG